MNYIEVIFKVGIAVIFNKDIYLVDFEYRDTKSNNILTSDVCKDLPEILDFDFLLANGTDTRYIGLLKPGMYQCDLSIKYTDSFDGERTEYGFDLIMSNFERL